MLPSATKPTRHRASPQALLQAAGAAVRKSPAAARRWMHRLHPFRSSPALRAPTKVFAGTGAAWPVSPNTGSAGSSVSALALGRPDVTKLRRGISDGAGDRAIRAHAGAFLVLGRSNRVGHKDRNHGNSCAEPTPRRARTAARSGRHTAGKKSKESTASSLKDAPATRLINSKSAS
jgi:hypothetical protein